MKNLVKSNAKKFLIAVLVLLFSVVSFSLFSLKGVNAEENVAKIGETEYATLQDAVNAINNGEAESDTITLIANAEVDNIAVTADTYLVLNGYTVQAVAKTAFKVLNDATLYIDGTEEGSEVHGTLIAGYSGNNNGNIVIDGGTYTATIADEPAVQNN
ncbi:MAG: hypothetical protein J5779_01695 [Clostridia bacterium]|nr:hypothetical protein [Clostridia bacterium]